jgi:dihydrofolate reductase
MRVLRQMLMRGGRRLVVSENMTVDGVIDLEDGWFSPPGLEGGVDTSDLEATLREHMAAQDALLLGRATFESFRDYWPKQTDDTTGITAHLNQVQKYVFSATLDDPEWENTEILRGDLVSEVRALKEQPGGEIAVGGSISVVWELVAAGLADEFRLFVHPLMVGHGRRLFENDTVRPKLELTGSTVFRSGVVLLNYQAA